MQPIKVDRIPLHIQATRLLREAITQETYKIGEQLPPETVLAAQLGISRPTLREALLSLEREGLIVRRHGVGTFVAHTYGPQIESGLERMESILQLAERNGIHVTVADLEVTTEAPSNTLLRELSVGPTEPVTLVHRVLLADGIRAAYMVDAVPRSVLSPTDIGSAFHGSVLDLLRRKSDSSDIGRAVADITAVRAGAELARQLETSPHQPLLLLEERLFTVSGQTIDYSRNYFVPNLFRFHVIRR